MEMTQNMNSTYSGNHSNLRNGKMEMTQNMNSSYSTLRNNSIAQQSMQGVLSEKGEVTRVFGQNNDGMEMTRNITSTSLNVVSGITEQYTSNLESTVLPHRLKTNSVQEGLVTNSLNQSSDTMEMTRNITGVQHFRMSSSIYLQNKPD